MRTFELYDDGRIALGHDGIVLRRYYFPTFASKVIAYPQVRSVEVRPLGFTTGKGRLWGTDHPRYWLPLDLLRWRKERLVALDLGGRIKPAFTPDDTDQVLQILRERTGLAPVERDKL